MVIKASRIAPPAKEDDDSKHALLRVAKKLFAEKGFAGTSIKALTDLAKVNVSLVSYHFGGKRGLYRACISNLFSRDACNPARVLRAPDTAQELRVRFSLFFEELIGIYVEEPNAVKIIYQDMERLPMLDDDIAKRVFKIHDSHLEFMRSAQRRGLLAATIDPEVVTTAFFGIAHSMIRSDHLKEKYYGHTLRNPEHRKHMIQQVTQIFFDGILPSSPRGTS